MRNDVHPFITGLRAFFDAHSDVKPATVSAEAGLNKSAIRKMLAGDVASPRQDTAERIAAVLNLTVEQIIAQEFERVSSSRPTIAVAGHVGAGAIVDLCDAYSKGEGIFQVVCPPQISPRGVVAVEVKGDSMAPVYLPGTILFYSRDSLGIPVEAIGRICVCEDEDGYAWVKQVKTGSEEGTFSLLSVNPTSDTMHGVRLKWAAPVRFSLPPEFVEKV